jgi:hypothetical protein
VVNYYAAWRFLAQAAGKRKDVAGQPVSELFQKLQERYATVCEASFVWQTADKQRPVLCSSRHCSLPLCGHSVLSHFPLMRLLLSRLLQVFSGVTSYFCVYVLTVRRKEY